MTDINTQLQDEVLTISINGEFTLECFDQFHESYPTDMKGITQVNLDLSRVSMIDSSAIGMIVSLWKVVGQDNKKIHVVRASQEIKDALKIAQLDRLIVIQ